MISFDRTSTNLTAVWNEINSIKSDTSSMWDFVSTITGIDIASSIMSSISSMTNSMASISSEITSLNNNTSYFNNELYSLKTDTSSIALNTGSITSSISDIINSISTMTGGGGGGNYYLNIDDVLSSSLKYVYNMTGDITAIPTYDSFTFHGNIANFNSLSVDSLIKNFEIGDVDLISKLTISTSKSSNKFNNIKLFGKTFAVNNLRNIYTCELNFDNVNMCSMFSVSYFPINAANVLSNSIGDCIYTIFAKNIDNNTFNANHGCLNANVFTKNRFYQNYQKINASTLCSNTFVFVRMYELNCESMYGNSFECGPGNDDSCCTPNFICSKFNGNIIRNVLNNFKIDCLYCSGNYIDNITITGTSTVNTSRQINFIGKDIYGNHISDVWNVNVDCLNVRGDWEFSNIHSIKFKAESAYLAGGHGDYGSPNNMISVDCFDIHEITTGFSIYTWNDNYVGVGTFKLNYNVSWTNPAHIPTNVPIQPSNFYTLDFYNCDDYISNSIFTIPSFYSGYDEGNVWISGKPLSELGYTLSVSS